jgi:hypothetical protein
MPAQSRKTSRGGKRRGAGRPPTLEDPVRYILSLERTEIDALEEIAENESRSIASVVREAVAKYLWRRR